MELLKYEKRLGSNDNHYFLFHGYGADEMDLLSLADHIDPEGNYYSFRAPFGIEGHPGASWYYIPEGKIDSNIKTIILNQKLTAFEILDKTFQHIVTENKINGKVIFIGFSQGCFMAMHYAMQTKVDAVIGISGYIDISEMKIPESHGTKMLYLYDKNDEIVNYGRMFKGEQLLAEDLEEYLKSKGYDIKYIQTHHGHAIAGDAIQAINSFLESLK